MAVTLAKAGSRISLSKAAADAGITNPLTKLYCGLRWDANQYDSGDKFDLDASVFLLGADGKVLDDSCFVFYNQKDAPGVHHNGDERTGASEGDDESIDIDLTALDSRIEKIAFVVTIYEAEARGQNFGMVNNSGMRISDAVSGTEFINYELGEEAGTETAVLVGELYKHNGEWKFKAVGAGYNGGLTKFCIDYGVEI